MAGKYQIIQSQLPLVWGLGGHNLVVVTDPSGGVLGEFNGLATSARGQIKPIGYLPTDQLRVFKFSQARYYRSTQNQYVVFSSSSYADISSRINAMEQCMHQINAQNMRYPFLGLGKNSNSVASTLLSCIGGKETPLPKGAWIMPGVGNLLLPQPVIDGIRVNHGINTI